MSTNLGYTLTWRESSSKVVSPSARILSAQQEIAQRPLIPDRSIYAGGGNFVCQLKLHWDKEAGPPRAARSWRSSAFERPDDSVPTVLCGCGASVRCR